MLPVTRPRHQEDRTRDRRNSLIDDIPAPSLDALYTPVYLRSTHATLQITVRMRPRIENFEKSRVEKTSSTGFSHWHARTSAQARQHRKFPFVHLHFSRAYEAGGGNAQTPVCVSRLLKQ